MFNLENEIRDWCRKATPGWFFRGSQLAELEDHIHCAVSEHIADGASVQEAFQSATSRIGEHSSLRQEYRKNAGILTTTLCRIVRHPAPRLQYVAATLCVVGIVVLGISLRIEPFAAWTKHALAALYMIPLEWLSEAT
jgi:hypothetical protein